MGLLYQVVMFLQGIYYYLFAFTAGTWHGSCSHRPRSADMPRWLIRVVVDNAINDSEDMATNPNEELALRMSANKLAHTSMSGNHVTIQDFGQRGTKVEATFWPFAIGKATILCHESYGLQVGDFEEDREGNDCAIPSSSDTPSGNAQATVRVNYMACKVWCAHM